MTWNQGSGGEWERTSFVQTRGTCSKGAEAGASPGADPVASNRSKTWKRAEESTEIQSHFTGTQLQCY